MLIAHPDEIERTHVPVSSYTVGPYYFLKAMPRNVLVSEVRTFVWWVAKNDTWLRRESFDTLEEAMRYAARPSSEK